jgi:integrase
VPDMLKSAKSERTVPLTGWLADRMRHYLDNTHSRADELIAP